MRPLLPATGLRFPNAMAGTIANATKKRFFELIVLAGLGQAQVSGSFEAGLYAHETTVHKAREVAIRDAVADPQCIVVVSLCRARQCRGSDSCLTQCAISPKF